MRTNTGPGLALLASLALPVASFGSVSLAGPGGAIPDDTPAGISLPISVTDTFTVTGVSVTLDWPATATFGNTVRDGHTWIGDLVATLRYDDGAGTVRSATLFNRLGKTSPVSGHGFSADFTGSYTFADGGANLWAAAALATAAPGSVPQGIYQPSTNLFTFDNRSHSPVSLADAFSGLSARGTWTLHIADVAGGEVGRLDGWGLTVIPAPGPAALMGLGALAASRRRRRD